MPNSFPGNMALIWSQLLTFFYNLPAINNDLSDLPLLSELHWIFSMHSKDYIFTSARSE